jgi:hypothetical protein
MWDGFLRGFEIDQRLRPLLPLSAVVGRFPKIERRGDVISLETDSGEYIDGAGVAGMRSEVGFERSESTLTYGCM